MSSTLAAQRLSSPAWTPSRSSPSSCRSRQRPLEPGQGPPDRPHQQDGGDPVHQGPGLLAPGRGEVAGRPLQDERQGRHDRHAEHLADGAHRQRDRRRDQRLLQRHRQPARHLHARRQQRRRWAPWSTPTRPWRRPGCATASPPAPSGSTASRSPSTTRPPSTRWSARSTARAPASPPRLVADADGRADNRVQLVSAPGQSIQLGSLGDTVERPPAAQPLGRRHHRLHRRDHQQRRGRRRPAR